MSVHGGHFTTAKHKQNYTSPQRSELGTAGEKHLRIDRVLLDNQSVRTTRTGQVLKEVHPNLRGTTKTGRSDFRLADSRFNDSMDNDGSLTNFQSQRPSMRKAPSSKSRTELAPQYEYPQISMLEDLVQRKEELVAKLDSNEETIERKIGELTDKKQTIRDEQNILLKELEDLGLKLKDFDKSSGGINLRNCTVMSPFLVRFTQQAVNKLKGISENLSNKESKAEILRAIKSIESAKDERDELIIKILSFDLDTIRERQMMLVEDLRARTLEKQEAVAKTEYLSNYVAALEAEIEDERSYEKRYEELKFQKENAAQVAQNTGEMLAKVLAKKTEAEEQVSKLHFEIASLGQKRTVVNKELNHFLEEYYEKFGSKISDDANQCLKLFPERPELTDNIFNELKRVEINSHADWGLTNIQDIETVHEVYTSTLQTAGRILCMMGRSNVEAAIQSFVQDIVQREKNDRIEDVFKSCIAAIQHLETFANEKFEAPQELKQNFDIASEVIQNYISLQLKTTTVFYDMFVQKIETSNALKEKMELVQEKEKAVLELNRKKTELINSIPTLRNQNKMFNFQFSKLVFEQESRLNAHLAEGERRDHLNETADILENSILCQSLDQSLLEQSNLYPDESQAQDSGTGHDPARVIELKESKLMDKKNEVVRLQARISVLRAAIQEIESNMAQVANDKEYIYEKLKGLRRGLVEVLQKEAKEFQVISTLFDYISKPVLSRDIGISVLDNLQNDLANVSQQITSEINRQKRIIKLVNKHEDYSHEEKVFDEMLTANINKIKTELSKLNETQIPELKDIENTVSEIEAQSMQMKDHLNEVLDSIELNEQALLDKLENDVARGLTRLQVSKLFSRCKMLMKSNYLEYILDRLYPQEEEEDQIGATLVDEDQLATAQDLEAATKSDFISQLDYSIVNHKNTSNGKSGKKVTALQANFPTKSASQTHMGVKNSQHHYQSNTSLVMRQNQDYVKPPSYAKEDQYKTGYEEEQDEEPDYDDEEEQPHYQPQLSQSKSRGGAPSISSHQSKSGAKSYQQVVALPDEFHEDNEVNEAIMNTFPKKLFSKILAVFAQKYKLFRSHVLSKLVNGIIISKKTKLTKGLTTGTNSFDPLAYFEEQESKRKKTSLETFGFHKKLIRFDFENGKLLFYSNKTTQKKATGGNGKDEKLFAVSNKWVLEEEFDLDDVIDIILPEVSVKMLKSRMREFYQPSQFGVYNQAELYNLERCEFIPFSLEIANQGRVECLSDDLGIFLDLYSGVCFLQH